eukprot:TRINITY_DN4039_c0_g1_i1.p1 TRINITY_DN4039_c0_g1~~TRINITY_DN4039_c0_g1_i1.p1  ORF type:complete len:332 (-),score=78.70 TRINITY_DN4039_c0_g1_i1:472-1467(-)
MSDFVIKAKFGEDIRRIQLSSLSFSSLKTTLENLFEDIPKNFVLFYRDEDQDQISIRTDADLISAAEFFKGKGPMKIEIHSPEKKNLSPSSSLGTTSTGTSPQAGAPQAQVPFEALFQTVLQQVSSQPQLVLQSAELLNSQMGNLAPLLSTFLFTLGQNPASLSNSNFASNPLSPNPSPAPSVSNPIAQAQFINSFMTQLLNSPAFTQLFQQVAVASLASARAATSINSTVTPITTSASTPTIPTDTNNATASTRTLNNTRTEGTRVNSRSSQTEQTTQSIQQNANSITAQLESLASMGFTDIGRNRELLERYGQNVYLVIEKLIEEGSKK